MAAQGVSGVRCQQQQARCQRLMHCAANEERGSTCSLARRQSYAYHRIRNLSATQVEGNFREDNIGPEKKGATSCTKRGRHQAQKLRLLGFSYLASSFLYIVTKVKALYNGFLGEVANESRTGVEAPMAEPYFSMPVLPN